MLLQPGQGMGLLGAYNTGYTPINPQMNHYNSLLGRIGGMTFTQPSGAMGPVANYFEGNTLMSGATGEPVYNLPAGAGQQYGTTQSYMDTLGRMPTSSNEIVSPYIYYRPQTDLSKIQEALKEQEAKKVEQAMTQVARGGGGGNRPDRDQPGGAGYSDGQVTGQLGQGQSPHGSMSGGMSAGTSGGQGPGSTSAGAGVGQGNGLA
tara:strand:- start:1211 stop:1825 length:615 start_codon:yes stop_codon:yes gene_type:complete